MAYSVYSARQKEIDRLEGERARVRKVLEEGKTASEEGRIALLRLKHHHREFAARAARTKRCAIWEWRTHLRKHRNQDIAKKVFHPQTPMMKRLGLVCERVTNLVEGACDLASARTVGLVSALWVGWDALIALVGATFPPWLVSWSPHLVVGMSISAFTLVGFSLFTLFDIQVDWNWPPTIKVEWATDPCEFVDCRPSDNRHVDVRIWLGRDGDSDSGDQTRPALIYPTAGDFQVWARGSDESGSAGYERRPLSLLEFAELRNICRADLVVAVGTASRSGGDEVNERLSRARALRVANNIQRRIRCERVPQVVALALWAPNAEYDDGFQRRVFAVALNRSHNRDPADTIQAWITAEADGLPLDVTARPNAYGRIDFCETPSNCAWRQLRPSIP